MKLIDRATSSRYVLWVSLLLIIYLSYRYPFQINFSGTSETYSDTPLPLQLFKYGFAFLFCLFLLLICRPSRLPADYVVYLCVVYFLAICAIVKATVLGEGSMVESAIWPLVASVFVFYSGPVSITQMSSYIGIVYAYALAWDLLQIALFFLTGRLPALAWSGTFSVRFGSFLDDPNGFSALCFLFLGWAYHQPAGWRKTVHTSLVVLMILASQSLTSIGFLGLIGLVWGARLLLALRGWLFFAAVFTVVVLAGLLYVGTHDLLMAIYEIKEGSISDHVAFKVSDIYDRGLLENLFGSAGFIFYEAWWVQGMVNFGIVWVTFFFLSCAYPLYVVASRWSAARQPTNKAVYLGMMLFMAFLMLGGVNLPFYTIFPVNFVYYMLVFLLLSRRLGAESSVRMVFA
ncbi:hypothetical protein [Sphaerotilus uruguayifluvii]|uniref:O-antigen polymerase n=1 Tax=Sphaerotilus uruguayifluvii TaxID=2735897 RepID=A0ABX2G3H7_9BURK|nr:hypothetical protein [Leptothrix sp. C29]NRT56865.1 hypothetical protein [Leptothrix sp. C29]